MKLEDIVCDFEYAEKLRELGLYKRSLFWYNSKGLLELDDSIPIEYAEDFVYFTYTVAELGEMLPNMVEGDDEDKVIYYDGSLQIIKAFDDIFEASYSYYDQDLICFADPKEANARAKLLIWLIENKHVNVEEL